MFPLSFFEKPDPVRFLSDRDCALGECTLLHECSGVWSLKCRRNLEPFPSQIYRLYVEFSICGILCWDPNVVTWLSWILVLDYSGLFKKPERNWAVWFTLIYHVQQLHHQAQGFWQLLNESCRWLEQRMRTDQVSHEKNPLTFHYAGCSIGILIIVQYNPHLTV